MVSKQKKPGILKGVIFEIAKNNGVPLSKITKNKKSKYKTVELLKELDLLDFVNIVKLPDGETGEKSYEYVKFKGNIETLQKIATILDNKELSRLMTTEYYKYNFNYFLKNLMNSLNENRLYPLPDMEYIGYALTNSPSNVRFFLLENDINALKSFYQRCVESINENAKGRIKIDLLKKYNMYLVWDNVIFEKIQEDLQNKILLIPITYFAGYLPLAKKTLEKLLELSDVEKKEEKLLLKVEKVLGSIKNRSKKPLRHT